jgi:exoribonuclease R
MDIFEYYFDTNILPKYGNPIQQDLTNDLPHYLSISNRIDMTVHPVYVIDPTGCTDADDGFSIYYDDNKLYLAVYIADPTEYINPHSELWTTIVQRAITHYPSNREPIHLMPESIVQQASLSTNLNDELKQVIAIITEIDRYTYLPIGEPTCTCANILVSKATQYSYYDTHIDVYIKLGLKIGQALQQERKTHGAMISKDPVSSITTQGTLRRDTKLTTDLKNMIAEFAIFVNTIIAKLLSTYLSDIYLVTSNELLGVSEYTQFTSPLRRASDCIIHYLIKSIMLKVSVPFTPEDITRYNKHIQFVMSAEKKLSYIDHKFRLLEVMYQIIVKDQSVKITLHYLNNTGPYLNFMITAINEYPVKIAYSAREFNYPYLNFWITHPDSHITLTHINPFKQYDSEIFPQISDFIKQPY